VQQSPVLPWFIDVVVANVDLSPDFSNFKNAIWLVIAPDRLDQPFLTPQTIPSKRLTWQCPFRNNLALPAAEYDTSIRAAPQKGDPPATWVSSAA
jgi:hypothetical protein